MEEHKASFMLAKGYVKATVRVPLSKKFCHMYLGFWTKKYTVE